MKVLIISAVVIFFVLLGIYISMGENFTEQEIKDISMFRSMFKNLHPEVSNEEVMKFLKSLETKKPIQNSLRQLSNYKYNDWMSKLDPNKRMIDISIPGTHDSLTYGNCWGIFHPVVESQDNDVYKQLQDGIRYLDLRFGRRKTNDPITSYHGPFICSNEIHNVMNAIARFVKENPTEILILEVKLTPHQEIDGVIGKFFAELGVENEGSQNINNILVNI